MPALRVFTGLCRVCEKSAKRRWTSRGLIVRCARCGSCTWTSMNSLRYLSTLLGSAPSRASRRLSKAKRRHQHPFSPSQASSPQPASNPPGPVYVSPPSLPPEPARHEKTPPPPPDAPQTYSREQLPTIDIHPPPPPTVSLNNSSAPPEPSSLPQVSPFPGTSSSRDAFPTKNELSSSPVTSLTPSTSSPLLNLIHYCFRRLLALVGLCAVKPSSTRLAVSPHSSLENSQSHSSPFRWFSILRPALSRKRSTSEASFSLQLLRQVDTNPIPSNPSSNPNNNPNNMNVNYIPDSDRSPTPSPSLRPSSISSQSSKAALSLLSRPKVLVLDLDETLIHSTSRLGGLPGVASGSWRSSGLKVRVVEVVFEGKSVVYHVYKRPWVDFFLRKVYYFPPQFIAYLLIRSFILQVASWYNVVVFTASMQEYADPVIDWLDQGHGLIGRRLFREVDIF